MNYETHSTKHTEIGNNPLTLISDPKNLIRAYKLIMVNYIVIVAAVACVTNITYTF